MRPEEYYCPSCRHFFPASCLCPTCGGPRCPWCGYCEACEDAFWEWAAQEGERYTSWRMEGCFLPEPCGEV